MALVLQLAMIPSTMAVSLRLGAFQLERSQGAERLLPIAAMKSLKDRESIEHSPRTFNFKLFYYLIHKVYIL
jgi:hypothetical protein